MKRFWCERKERLEQGLQANLQIRPAIKEQTNLFEFGWNLTRKWRILRRKPLNSSKSGGGKRVGDCARQLQHGLMRLDIKRKRQYNHYCGYAWSYPGGALRGRGRPRGRKRCCRCHRARKRTPTWNLRTRRHPAAKNTFVRSMHVLGWLSYTAVFCGVLETTRETRRREGGRSREDQTPQDPWVSIFY